MCGIVAAVSPASNIVPVLLEGLRKLEYRGYDSAGIAVVHNRIIENYEALRSVLSAQGYVFTSDTETETETETIENRVQPPIFNCN
jgi:glucosamine 6-phosphate synthetase-like amidotransferase/phosphosugar isomerase protein